MLTKLLGFRPLRTNFTKKFMNKRKVTWVGLVNLPTARRPVFREPLTEIESHVYGYKA